MVLSIQRLPSHGIPPIVLQLHLGDLALGNKASSTQFYCTCCVFFPTPVHNTLPTPAPHPLPRQEELLFRPAVPRYAQRLEMLENWRWRRRVGPGQGLEENQSSHSCLSCYCRKRSQGRSWRSDGLVLPVLRWR